MSSPRPEVTLNAPRAPSQAQSITSYDALAAEYDSVEHRTTRELERLSGFGLEASGLLGRLGPNPLMVELGSGTGALSREIAAARPGGCLLLSDPAPRMLRRAEDAVAAAKGGLARIALRGSAEEILARLLSPPTAILAGLADPYISESLLVALRRACAHQTVVFCSLPSRRWAEVERGQRLGIASDQTRFRTREGYSLYSRSLCLDTKELRKLFADGGFEVLASGTERARGTGWEAASPEVGWVAAQPRLGAAPA
jgi:hypothetical protein